MKLSQYPPGERDVLLTYSTDTEKVDPEKAREQASILAEQHFELIPTKLRVAKKRFYAKPAKRTVRCVLIDDHSILARDIGIVAPKEHGDETESQCLTSVSGHYGQALMIQTLRTPESSLERTEKREEGFQFRIRTQVSFAEWQATYGKPEYKGKTKISK